MSTDAFAWLAEPVRVPDREAGERADRRQSQLTKPQGSLGVLEQVAVQLASLQGSGTPQAARPFICVFAADHGVAAAGVSAYPQAVTQQMLANFAAGGAAVSVLARTLDAPLEVIDVGTTAEAEEIPGVRIERVGSATADIRETPAMDDTQLAHALLAGRNAVTRARDQSTDVFIAGDMGIGNTTSATAVAAALLQVDAAVLTGPGTGLDEAGVARKVKVIEAALQLHACDPANPLSVLRKLGGFEIAAIAGAYVACAQYGLPALVDGFAATAAALAACRLQPGVRDWLLFAHRSAEPGHRAMLEALQARPLLDLGMRLGEGSAAALAVSLLRSACDLHNDMATFTQAGVAERDDA